MAEIWANGMEEYILTDRFGGRVAYADFHFSREGHLSRVDAFATSGAKIGTSLPGDTGWRDLRTIEATRSISENFRIWI